MIFHFDHLMSIKLNDANYTKHTSYDLLLRRWLQQAQRRQN